MTTINPETKEDTIRASVLNKLGFSELIACLWNSSTNLFYNVIFLISYYLDSSRDHNNNSKEEDTSSDETIADKSSEE